MDQIELGIDVLALSFMMKSFPKETLNEQTLKLINKMGSLVANEASPEMLMEHLVNKYLSKE